MNNVNWGFLDGGAAEIMQPGDTAGEGHCEAREWGVAVEDVVVYGGVETLRAWAQSIMNRLPADRRGAPLLVVDRDRQSAWVQGATAGIGPDWTATVETVRDLVQAVAADPGAAGWTLGADVAELHAFLDEGPDQLCAGVTLTSTGHYVGIEPLHGDDLATTHVRVAGPELADACLTFIAARINDAY